MGAGQVVFVNDLFDEDISIDNMTFPWVHSISIAAKLNSARKVTFQFSSREGLEMCSVGRTLRVQMGKSDIAEGIDFTGKIKMVIPGFEVSTAIAFDYIADLNSSQLVNYSDSEFAGMDLILAGKHAINNSFDDNRYVVDETSRINLDAFNVGCQVRYRQDQGFGGYQTRKSFLDKIFAEAYTEKPSDRHLSGAYPALTFLRWYYAIRKNNRLVAFQPDIYVDNPVMHIGKNNFNVADGGLQATIDTARMVNSVVVQSSEIDYVATYADTGSISQYGSQSLLVDTSLTSPSKMEDIAYSLANSNREPSGAYTVKVENAHWVDLGNVVEVSIPTLERSKRMVVKAYTTSITNTISTTLTLGSSKLTVSDLVKRVGKS